MKKSNLIKVILFIATAIIIIVGYSYFSGKIGGEKIEGNKTIEITIVDEENNKVLVENEKFDTTAVTLADFLKENSEKLDVKLEKGSYGNFIVGIKGLETTDMAKGPWWIYTYKSPKQSIDYSNGEAPGIDKLNLQDGDVIKFRFTKNM